jgi:hypothetical protein
MASDDSREGTAYPLSNVVDEELRWGWLSEASCVGCSFEGFDLITDTLVSLAACPFGLGWKRLVNAWQAVEAAQAQFRCFEAFAADLIVFL